MSRFKDLTKTALCAVYKYSGWLTVQERLARLQGSSFAVVLLFHRVTDDIPEDGLTVGTKRFRAICRMLRRGFHVVPLSDTVRLVRPNRSIPARCISITFDDCYRDNLRAAEILAEHGLPATFFLPTGFVGTEHVFPWDAKLPRMKNLCWADVRAMAGLGFDFGSHTVNHVDLGSVPLDVAKREIVESKKVIEDQIQKPVRWLAYPFGQRRNIRAAVVPLIQEVGYEACWSGYGGFIKPGSSDFILPREAVPYFRSVLNLELHLTGCLNWLYALKRNGAFSPFEVQGRQVSAKVCPH